MSFESYLRSLNSCDELEQSLKGKFPRLQIRVLPKNESLSNGTCGEFPAVFTIEVQAPIPASGEGVYCKWCADVDGEDYIRNWGEGEKRQEKLASLVNTIVKEMQRY
ncbi:MAG: hypothetical protein JWR26_2408 [Pedosphaera sp.]|nr:hypothetical protein [Pedosphaera sp.]